MTKRTRRNHSPDFCRLSHISTVAPTLPLWSNKTVLMPRENIVQTLAVVLANGCVEQVYTCQGRFGAAHDH